MATNNKRILGYLPPQYHHKLREYMEEQSLTESAALVRIVRQFFALTVTANVPQTTSQKDDAIASLQADMASIKQQMALLEQEVASIQRRRGAYSKTYPFPSSPVKPPPLSSAQLASRLGVSESSVEEASEKGEDYFKDWSKTKDPALQAWQKRGNLFYLLSN
jgi:hypothetical protein